MRAPRGGPAAPATPAVLFHSHEFLFVYLPLVWLLHRLCPARGRSGLLAVASIVFYGSWNWRFVPLLLASTLVDYCAGLAIGSARDERTRKAWLIASLVTNLGLLAFFKYAGFFAREVDRLAGRELLPILDVVLPVGISFYTFQSLSYTVDVWRREAEPVRSFADFACYVSLFSQLVAGPIVRFTLFRPQLDGRRADAAGLADGLQLFAIGLAKKVLVADSVAVAADQAFDGALPGFRLAWLGALAYTLQIYFDFSGYSDMAVGLGRMFGFELPQNFDSPYRATSVTDFWRRWHISLSTWLRDYLYIPLGGNRRGPLRTYANLLATMLLGGLWHGASWNFVVWGGYHGALLALERRFAGGRPGRAPSLPGRLVRRGATFVAVLVGWVFFRSADLPRALGFLRALVTPGGGEGDLGLLVERHPSALAMLAAGLAIAWLAPNTWQWRPPLRPAWAAACGLLLVATVCVCLSQSYSPFLYFQF